jgi:hypothetical protein
MTPVHCTPHNVVLRYTISLILARRSYINIRFAWGCTGPYSRSVCLAAAALAATHSDRCLRVEDENHSSSGGQNRKEFGSSGADKTPTQSLQAVFAVAPFQLKKGKELLGTPTGNWEMFDILFVCLSSTICVCTGEKWLRTFVRGIFEAEK